MIPAATTLLQLAAVASLAAQPASEAVREARDASRRAVDDAETLFPARSNAAAPIGWASAATATPPRAHHIDGFSIERALRGAGVDVQPPSALPETTVLTRRAGLVVPVTDRDILFVPDPEGRIPGEGPVIIAPTAELERLRASLADGERTAPFIVSGELTLYRGRNHLVLSAFARTGGATATTDTPAAATSPEAPDAVALDPDVADVIADLRRRRSAEPGAAEFSGRARQLDRTAAARAADEPDLVPEGSVITQRRARLERSPEGDWALVFDNDADRPPDRQAAPTEGAVPPPPMVVMPCALLERMEAAAEIFGDTAAVIVSGRVHIYDDVNYIRPTMFFTERRTDINPMQ